MSRRYGTNVTLNAFSTALSEFNRRLRNPESFTAPILTPEQVATIEAARLQPLKAPVIGARTLTPEEQAYRAQLAAALPAMNLSPRDRAVLEYYWGIGPGQIPHTQTATAANVLINGALVPRMTVSAIVNRPLVFPLPPNPAALPGTIAPGTIISPGPRFAPITVTPPTNLPPPATRR